LARLRKLLAASAGIVIIIIVLALVSNVGLQTSHEKFTVTTTFFPLYDWTTNIVGDKGKVIDLTPSGTDPHDLDPTPQDISSILSSNVFVYDSAGIDPWVEKVLPTIDKSRTVIIDATLGVDIIYGEAGLADPHFWVEPSSVIIAVKNIEAGLEQADPANSAYYKENAQNYIIQLQTLNRAFIGNLTSVRIRTIIPFHEAFGYWKRAYNITESGIYGFEPEGEPSAAHMQDLLNLAKNLGITMVLASNLDDPHWCQVLADQIGGRVFMLDPLEGPTSIQNQMGNYTYLGQMYYDIGVLKEALA
jgi:zinc transport system substrate-binding protein